MSSSRQINYWFHKKQNKQSPFDFVKDVCYHFRYTLDKMKFELDKKFDAFVYSMCDFVCFSKAYDGRRSFIAGPKRHPITPQGWNKDCESVWIETLYYKYFNDEFWDLFWSEHPHYDEFFDRIKGELCTILPLYVRRNMEFLLKNELIIRDEETNKMIRWEEYEENDDDDEYLD
jgi:hypothetical protein